MVKRGAKARRSSNSVFLHWINGALAAALFGYLSAASATAAGRQSLTDVNVIERVVDAQSFASGSAVELAPDGKTAAITLSHAKGREPLGDDLFTQAGVFMTSNGAEILLVDLVSGRKRLLCERPDTCWNPSWSPDGSRLAFFSNRGGMVGLWVWERASGSSRNIQSVRPWNMGNFIAPSWFGDGRRLIVKTMLDQSAKALASNRGYVFSTDEGAKPSSRPSIDPRYGDLAVVDVETDHVLSLGLDKEVMGWRLSPDQVSLAVTVNQGLAAHSLSPLYSVKILQLKGTGQQLIARDVRQEWGQEFNWSGDGNYLAYTSSDLDGPRLSIVQRLDRGWATQTVFQKTFSKGTVFVGGPRWTGTAFIVGVNYRGSSEGGEFFAYDPTRRSMASLSLKGRSIMDVARVNEKSGETAAFITSQEAGLELLRLLPSLKAINSTRLGDQSLINNANNRSASVDVKGTVLWPAERVGEQPSVQRLQRGGTKSETLLSLNTELGRKTQMRSIFTWIGADGVRRGGVLIESDMPSAVLRPTIVCAYPGNPVLRYKNSRDLCIQNLADLAIANGYSLFVPELPTLKSEPIQEFSELILPAIDDLLESGRIDPRRLYFIGHSAGAYAAMCIATQTRHFAAVVEIAGISNMTSAYGSFDAVSGRADISAGRMEGGPLVMGAPPWKAPEKYLRNSPLFHVEQISRCCQVNRGKLKRANT